MTAVDPGRAWTASRSWTAGSPLHPEKIIFAAGRMGNTENLGLAAEGVSTDERGRIVVDSYRTTARGSMPPET